MVPLSEKIRPSSLQEVFGQERVTSWIQHLIEEKKPLSLLLHGPPGSGKTTIARIYQRSFPGVKARSLSAVTGKIADVKKILDEQPFFQEKTLLFVDEIHRFNKAQQDVFLPFIEKGSLILIGATTENPSFCMNDALLSRLRILSLSALEEKPLGNILLRYQKMANKKIGKEVEKHLISYAKGDARHFLNLLENLEGLDLEKASPETLALHLQEKAALYDRAGDGHYQLISALHKSVRGSDPDASLYWLARMLTGGEDPLFIARRLIRMAVEDIGLTDEHALRVCFEAFEMYRILGSPEGEIGLARAVIYLALSPKSNSVYTSFNVAYDHAKKTSQEPPPKIIINGSTRVMKEMGYGEGYLYDHDQEDGFSGQNYFPDNLERKAYYHPVMRGFERELTKRLDYFKRLRWKRSFADK